MTVPLITLTLIAAAFLNGLHNDAVGAHAPRYHYNDADRVGCPGRPSDWPKDGPGAHNGPAPQYYEEQDEDNFIGAE